MRARSSTFGHADTTILLGILLALSSSCTPDTPTAGDATVKGNGQPVETVELAPSVEANGALRIRSEDPANKAITSVTELDASLSLSGGELAPSTAFAEIGALELASMAFEVNGISKCKKDFKSGGAVTCTNPAVPTPPPEAAPAASVDPTPAPTRAPAKSFSAADYKPKVVHHSGMKCGSHMDDGKIWQKSYDVGVEASADALDAVARVVHDVYYSYSGNPYSVTTRATNFTTAIGFLTPVTQWSLGQTTVHLKTGESFQIGAGQVDWQDDDPSKKARTRCGSTAL